MKSLIILSLIFTWTASVVLPVKPSCIGIDVMCELDNVNHPAKECFAKMSARVQESVKADCIANKGTPQFDTFIQNMEMICAAKGSPIASVNICPLSFTTHPMDDLFCDFDDSNHPIHDCYSSMSAQIQQSVHADCLTYVTTPQMDDFSKNIQIICDAKTPKILPFEFTEPKTPLDFQFCELDDDSHSMHDCYSMMSEQIQKHLKADCLAYIGTDAMDDFMKNIDVLCEAKKSNIRPNELTTLPFDFEFCELEGSSHPMHDCYSMMSEQIQKHLKADCLAYIGTDAMDDFMKNIDVLCEAKKSNIRPNELTTETPPFDFDQCALEEDKHPVHDCYSLMSSQIQKSLKADCIATEGTPAFDDLGKNIEVLCKAKHSEIRDLSLSTITPPDFLEECHLGEETHPLHNCYRQMNSRIQKSVQADCLVHENTALMEAFKKNIMLLCQIKGILRPQ